MNFTSPTSDIIIVKHTRLHVIFRHNLILGTLPTSYIEMAFTLINVSHVTIQNNLFLNITDSVDVSQSLDVVIANNTIIGKVINAYNALFRIYQSEKINISGNVMMGNFYWISIQDVASLDLVNNVLVTSSKNDLLMSISASRNVQLVNNTMPSKFLIDDVENLSVLHNFFPVKIESWMKVIILEL